MFLSKPWSSKSQLCHARPPHRRHSWPLKVVSNKFYSLCAIFCAFWWWIIIMNTCWYSLGIPGLSHKTRCLMLIDEINFTHSSTARFFCETKLFFLPRTAFYWRSIFSTLFVVLMNWLAIKWKANWFCVETESMKVKRMCGRSLYWFSKA